MSVSGSSSQDQNFLNDLNLLAKTQKLSSLTVKDGKLCKKTISDRVKGFLPKEQEKTKEALKNRLKEIVQYTTDKHFVYQTKQIFLTKISQLQDLEFIKQLRKEKLLTKELESLMSLELGRLRDDKDNRAPDETARLARRVERAKLASRLGVAPEVNKGATGTAILRSTKGTRIGVFKPTNPYTPVVARCKNLVKKTCGGQLYFLSHKTKAQAEAEVAAYHLDRHFGFGLSPESRMETIAGKEGAFQIFIKSKDENKFKEAAESIESLESKKEYTKEELNLFQMMAVFDFLIGNLDRHDENWFVKVIEGDIKELKTIDNANSFLRKNPKSADKVRNQYKWRRLNIAAKPFTEETKKFIREKLSDTNLQAFVEAIKQTLPEFMDDEMEGNLYVRIAVLRKAAEEQSFIPYHLGLLITDKDIHAFLHADS